MYEHPGGVDILEDFLGDDATDAFKDVGHSSEALEIMKDLQIGVLPQNERQYEKLDVKNSSNSKLLIIGLAVGAALLAGIAYMKSRPRYY